MEIKLKSLFILFLVGIFIVSCQENSFEGNIDENNDIIISKVNVLDNIESIANPIDVREYTLNPYDKDDEEINKQLLDIAIAAREYLKDNSINRIIYDKAKVSANKCFNLQELSSIAQLKSASIEYSNLVLS